MSDRIRIVHVINSFEPGGAETMLCNLVARTDRTRFEPSVVALIDDLTVAGPIQRAGIPLTTMGMSPGIPDPRGVVRLVRHLRKLRPDVVQTWMDHSNLIGGIAARWAKVPHVVWGIHHSDHVAGLTKRSTLLTVRACAKLSRRVPSRVIFCSEHARRLYAERGFPADKVVVIPNGFDTSTFRPDPEARRSIRAELGLAAGTPLVGLIARYNVLKDHATFLRSAAIMAKQLPDVRFVLCGLNVDDRNTELMDLISELSIGDRCHLLGPRADVARIAGSLDVLASSSVSEAFPLVVGEAMACGVPCAVTDVGDSALIVGSTGRVVQPRDPAALAAAVTELLGMPFADRATLGLAARRRVCEHFDLGNVTSRYESHYEELVARRADDGATDDTTGRRPEPAVAA